VRWRLRRWRSSRHIANHDGAVLGPETIVVNTTSDSASLPAGTVSLRQAVAEADESLTPTTITFAATPFNTSGGETISLGSELTLDGEDVTIDVPSTGLTIVGSIVNDTSLTLVGNSSSHPLVVSGMTGYGEVTIDANTGLTAEGAVTVTSIADGGVLAINSSSAISVTSNISSSGAFVQSGTGATALSGANSYTGGTTISGGTLVIGVTGALPSDEQVVNNSTLKIEAGTSTTPVTLSKLIGSGVLDIGSGSDAGYLQLAFTTSLSNSTTSAVAMVNITSTSTLDITDDALDINYGSPGNDPINSVLQDLVTGYHSGNWTGSLGGIISCTAATPGQSPVASVGYADGNPDTLNGIYDHGAVAGLQWDQIEIMYTTAGDANLDRMVNFQDLLIVAQHFNQTGQDWAEGNFIYNTSSGSGVPTGLGTVNFADLLIVAQNFNKTLTAVSDWANFTPIDDGAYAVNVLSDGDILFSGCAYGDEFGLVELNPDGTLNTSFGSGGFVTTNIDGWAQATSATELPDGDILVGGFANDTDDGDQALALVEYTATGSLVTSFGSGGIVLSDLGFVNAYAFSVNVLSDGNILVGVGDQDVWETDFFLEEFNSDGSPDSSFGTDGIMSSLSLDYSFSGVCMSVLSDGNILVAGGNALAEFNSDGGLDTSFGSSGFVVASGSPNWQSVAELSSGEIVVAGVSDGEEIIVAEYNSDGSPNTSFGSGGIAEFSGDGAGLVNILAVSDDEIQIGVIGIADGLWNVELAEFNSDGVLNSSFGSGGIYAVELGVNDAAWAMALTPDGKLVVGGYCYSGSGGFFAAEFEWSS
jgi:uncharacterized delta-60 repeat protein